MALKQSRPLSPHLTIWKWGPHMAVSILNRACGIGLATVGTLGFVGWLLALSSGPDSYSTFMQYATGLYGLGYLVAVGLSFVFFFHLCAGVRHFVMDAGAGFELKENRMWSLMTIAIAVFLTAAMWLMIMWKAL